MDTLRSRRSFRWLGHGLGIIAISGLEWNYGWWLPWDIGIVVALVFAEVLLSLLDFNGRRLKVLAPGAFPFKNLSEDDRSFVQDTLLTIPKTSALRACGTWVAATVFSFFLSNFVAVHVKFSLVEAFGIYLFGASVSAIAQYLGNTAMGRRVAPFYYFEGDTPDALSKRMPSLSKRFAQLALFPLLVALPVLATSRENFSSWVCLWVALWALAVLIAAKRVFQDIVVAPIEDLGSALGKFGSDDYNSLLDVTSGDELGVTTNRYNKAVRATDRRFFVAENFGHSVPKALVEDLFEGGLKLDGETREVSVLVIRFLNSEAPPAYFNRFCEVAQGPLDKFGACLEELSLSGMVAVFNAPLKIENPGHAAALCAWAIKEALQVFRNQQRMQNSVDLPFALGIAFGPAQVGLVGPRGRQVYKTFGKPAIEARSLASQEGFWISPDLTALLGPGFDFEAKPKKD
jgi:hypothetical protein